MIKFLGSFRFALVLIALSAIGVIVGTILESRADSHGVAVDWIYGNPLFQVLLAGYFINIFLSTLSRRPFKMHHIPFIITHIGLLMIISGVFIKSIAGTQGHMQIVEGSFSDDLILPNERALYVQQKDHITSIPESKLKIKEFYPHAEEKLFGWVKDNAVHIAGFNPLPIRKEPYPIDIGESELLNVYTMEGEMKDPYVLITKYGIKTRINNISFDKIESYIAYDQGFGGYALQAKIPFVTLKDLPQNVQNVLYWIGELYEEGNFIEHLRQNKWPFIEGLENEEMWLEQMWALKDDLPEAPHFTPKMFSAYVKLNLPFKTITLETPLFRRIEPKEPPLKKEDQEPLAIIDFEGKTYPLVYDTKGGRLKTPAGKYLLNYQPHRVKLPYFVRLHDASDIKYPGSDQTVSYECRLTLISKTGGSTPCALQMNQVHETEDSYRFYLAGMGPIDSYGVRTVQLVVNRDPAKWILTYPGALLLSIGIILLFWKNKILSFFN